MPRPEKDRIVNTPPLFNSFKPTGFVKSGLKQVIISLDEYEAIRLADNMGLDHSEAAQRMEISRSTFTRLIEKARKKVSSFIIEGTELVIEGGNVHFRDNIIRCMDCEHMFKINFNEKFDNCPSCGSSNLIDMAGGYGHGRCCSKGPGNGAGRGWHGGRG
ncbi:MAG TPA: DNA-binding protein [Spirochaeta sp.]|nr:DNA-binding protein [Spirochaeta sp.]